MKKIVLLLSFVIIIYSAKAQYVTIPDAHFVTWLQTNFPGCMVGNQMDTTCAGITSATSLFCTNDTIADLTGIQYFHNLQSLGCGFNLLNSLPPLANSIHWLECRNCSLTSLPALPDSLIYLECSNNNLTTLPSLPSILQQFYCGYNQLSNLPTLPNSITELACNNNQLLNLPALSATSIYHLVCTNNHLSSLPALPNTLTALWCDTNNISCFPVFPNSLNYGSFAPNFRILGNPFTCLPNYNPRMDATLLAYPLCITGDTINNPHGCLASEGIEGYLYKDNDSNCLYNAGDLPKNNFVVKLFDSGNNLVCQTNSAINGIYDLAESVGTYSVKIDTTGMPFTINCLYPGIDSLVVLTSANALQTNVDFPITCKQSFDIGAQSVWDVGHVFPGMQHNLYSIAGDLSNWYGLNCAAGVSGQVVITIIGPVTYNNITTGALTPTVAGNIFTYNIVDFGSINGYTAFGLVFTTDTTAQIGDSICVNISVTPTTGDNNASNNNFNYCYQVGNSFDPNYKETYPVNVPVGFVDYFTYTIHFQNTGIAPAQNIHLQDALDANLDLNTFQVINYSHPNTFWLNGNLLSVNFPNIQLPDSTTDFNGSQGFIQYRIKPKTGLPAGTLLHNTGYIYFDYNAPIVTNTTINEFMGTAGIATNNKQSTFSIYPNPSTGKYSIELSEGTDVSKLTIEVSNLLGEVIYQSKINNKQSTIDISKEPNGIYFVRIIGGEQALNQKVVRE